MTTATVVETFRVWGSGDPQDCDPIDVYPDMLEAVDGNSEPHLVIRQSKEMMVLELDEALALVDAIQRGVASARRYGGGQKPEGGPNPSYRRTDAGGHARRATGGHR